jgi:hypothetical protein
MAGDFLFERKYQKGLHLSSGHPAIFRSYVGSRPDIGLFWTGMQKIQEEKIESVILYRTGGSWFEKISSDSEAEPHTRGWQGAKRYPFKVRERQGNKGIEGSSRCQI